MAADTDTHTAAETLAAGTRTFGTILLGMIERVAVWCFHELAKPAVRTVVIGIILIIIGAFFIEHSAWTFPLVIIGALMIIATWVGTRMQGRFGIEWNDGGAQIELRAGMRPRTSSLQTSTLSSTPVAPVTPVPTPSSALAHADVIEGEAHTIEIDVDELRALVAAAERANTSAGSATTNGTPVTWQETPSAPDPGVDETLS